MGEILKVVGGGLIALVAAYIGLLIKRRYKTREIFFLDAKSYFEFFEKELTYEKTAMPDINKRFLDLKSGDFSNWLADMNNATSKSTQKRQLQFLKDTERQQLENTLSGLGKSGYNEQVAYVKRCKTDYKEKADRCAAENKKYGGMYFKLCVLIGIAILILVV